MLASLLQTTHDPGVKEEATAALWNLSSADMLKPVILEAATDSLVQQLAVLDADGIRMLASLLQTTHDPGVKEEATAALWNLSSADMLKPVILEAATDSLVQQVCPGFGGYQQNGVSGDSDPLRHYSTPTFKNATGVLRNISAANATARKRLRICPNLIESLVQFLTIAIQRNQVDSQSVENVVCLLRNLSYRIQEVEDPNYDPATAHVLYTKSGSKSAPNSPKPKKDKDKKKDSAREVVTVRFNSW
ncbi:hypothetical protein OESDEN_03581 [Oesophagostomum dentatum]|uniref:Armadillo/beta-catenin-like repeat protein n=1 Tax=Oesophagostomum dentatum TaxID=61180 RepID=A0A0B1TK23_OESDE|nr:hypothetical protein OESDEN_03581 [Oesophagostomum dentatum]